MPLSDSILDGLTGIVGPGTGADQAGRRHPVRLRRDGGAQAAARGGRLPAEHDRTSRAASQLAARESVPIVTRGSGTGLSGGSVPSDGRDGAVPRADERDPRRRSAEPHAPRTAGRHDDHDRRGGGTPWAVLSAGSRVDAHQHHRRQRRGELRRAARPEVRRHARLRDGARGRAGRRPNRAVRQPVREGRRRLLDEGPVHRIRRARSASSPRCC